MTGAVADAAHLLHPVHGAEQLARGVGAVPHVRRLQAVVTITAGLAGLTKIGQQAHAAAVGGLGQAQQGVEFAAQPLLELFAGGALIDHASLVHHVLQAVAHPGVGGSTIAPGAAGLLVVAFDVFRHVQVRHKAHIGLVDAHTKRNRRHHHQALVTQKAVLVCLAHFAVQTRVVGQGFDTGLAQHSGNVFHFSARLAIYDASVTGMFALDKAQQLGTAFSLFHDGVADIGPVKAANKSARLLQLQTLQHIGTRQVIGGSRQGHARHAGVALMQHR